MGDDERTSSCDGRICGQPIPRTSDPAQDPRWRATSSPWTSILGRRRTCSSSSRCTDSLASIENAILQWRADDLEAAAAEEGLVLAKVRTIEEFLNEPQYTEVLSTMPLITVEKIGESEPMPFEKDGRTPLDGIRAFGMGHVIAGGAMGRDLAMYGADVLNIWRPNATEVEAFAWDVQVGMRSTILDSSKEDRATFDNLLKRCRRLLRQQAPRLSGAKRSYRRRAMREEARTDPCQGRPPWRHRAVVEPSRLR